MNFEQIYEILTLSFEPSFHRGYECQKALLDNPNYKIAVKEENNKTLGFLSYWEFNDFIFIEHFATNPNIRGKGIGGQLLDEILSIDKLKVLEVEPPHTDIDKRRIKYYERHGLILNDYEYYQPPYKEEYHDERLFIMSSEILNRESFLNVVKKIYSDVYKRNMEDYGIYN